MPHCDALSAATATPVLCAPLYMPTHRLSLYMSTLRRLSTAMCERETERERVGSGACSLWPYANSTQSRASRTKKGAECQRESERELRERERPQVLTRGEGEREGESIG